MAQSIEKSRLQEAQVPVLRAAVDGISSALAQMLEESPDVVQERMKLYLAEATVAAQVETDRRSHRQSSLVRMRTVFLGMRASILRGEITRREDAETLAAVFMDTEHSPSSALGYLRGTTGSLVERRLTPQELAGALVAHSEYINGFANTGSSEGDDVPPSLASVIRAADYAGVDLSFMQEDDYALLASNLTRFNFVRVDSYADQHGNPYQVAHPLKASKVGTTPIDLVAACDDDNVWTRTRGIRESADMSSGILDDPQNQEFYIG